MTEQEPHRGDSDKEQRHSGNRQPTSVQAIARNIWSPAPRVLKGLELDSTASIPRDARSLDRRSAIAFVANSARDLRPWAVHTPRVRVGQAQDFIYFIFRTERVFRQADETWMCYRRSLCLSRHATGA